MHRIDLMSKKILHQISQDAGFNIPKIAEAVGCAPAVVEDRIAKLLDDGIVTGFRADVDLRRLNTYHEALVVGVPTHETDPEALRRLAQNEDVTRVFTMAAQASIAFHLRGSDPAVLESRAAELANEVGLAAHRCTLVVNELSEAQPAIPKPTVIA